MILRRVEYNISILDDKINKELEKHRKAASELLPKFTFALADGNRWMPLSAKALYESELKKAEEAGSKTLQGAVIDENAKAFVASKRDIVSKAAQQHYHEFNPGQQIPKRRRTSQRSLMHWRVGLTKR